VRYIKEVTYPIVTFLLFHELCPLLGLSSEYSIYLPIIFTILLCYGDRIKIFLLNKTVSGDLLKVVDLSYGRLRTLQKIRLRTTQKLRIYANLTGLLFPVFLALSLSAYLIRQSPNYLVAYLLLLSFLTATYNRFSATVYEKGILVSLASSIVVTVTSTLAVSIHYKLGADATFMTAYSVSALAALIGIDLLNLRYATFFNTRSIIMGGYGVKDAIFLIPALSSVTAKLLYNLITTLPSYI
jgi:uncharacterized membrane protein